MTREEIERIFDDDAYGNAQMSDLRIILTYISSFADLNSIHFFEVQTLIERNQLDVDQGDICKVNNVSGTGASRTYIYNEGVWRLLVDNTGSGGGGGTLLEVTENFTVGSLDAQLQEIDLQDVPDFTGHLFVFLNGMYLMMGVNYDYTTSNNTIKFEGATITQGDNLAVKYSI